MKVGEYTTTYDEAVISYPPQVAEALKEKIKKKYEKKFEQILRKAKNYTKYFYNIMYMQLVESGDEESVYYGFFFSKMRMEVDIKMSAAAAVGFDLYTKVRATARDLGLTMEEVNKILKGEMTHPKYTREDVEKMLTGAYEHTLNTEEYFITFNPIKMGLFTRDERIAIIKHEIHHMLRLHHLRFFNHEKLIKHNSLENNIENYVLDMEINGTFDNPYIRNLSGTKGHTPHVYPAVVKETVFFPAYEKGLISEKLFEEILSTNISAERMKQIIEDIKQKDPDFIKSMFGEGNPDRQEKNQQQEQGQNLIPELPDEDELDDIEDDNLSEQEMRERIEEMKKQIKELDEILKQHNTSEKGKQKEQEGQKGKDQNQQGRKEKDQNQQGEGEKSNNEKDKNNLSSMKQDIESKEEEHGNSQRENSSGKSEKEQESSSDKLKEEYDKTVSELAKKLAEAYMRGLLTGDVDNHGQFMRNIPKGLEKETVERKAAERLQDMIERTQEEFDFERPKSRGFRPLEFEKAYDNLIQILTPQNDYRQLLRNHIKRSEGLKSLKKSTWEVRSIMKPFDPNIKGKKKAKKPPLALIIDVSGSMSDAEVLSAYGEIIGIIQEEVRTGGAALRVIQADTIVTMDEFLENPMKKDIVKIMKRTGGGGTYMEPAIKRALGIGTSVIELPNGEKREVSNRALLNKKSMGVRPRTIFVVTDGWIEDEFKDIVPYGMPKDKTQTWLPPDVEIIWIVTGDFGKDRQKAREQAEEQLTFNYKQYGNQMKVIAIDKNLIMERMKNKDRDLSL